MVPGLRNLGNTCYAAAVLQQLEVATRSLPGLQPPQTSFTAVLLNCLQRLQPVALDEPTSDSPADVLHALRQCIGESMLPAGQEHDAVEAYEGSLASELQCLRCRHHFASQVTPFLALPLSIPLAPGRNAFGHARAAHRASLEGCLQQYLGYEALQGVTCTRCSLQASLEAAEADRLNHKLVSLREALWRDALFIESDTYQQAVQGAGLEWVGRSGPVAKRHVLARLPTMLCLQLRRVFWGPAGEVKVSGHVSFPLALRTDALGLPTLGHAPHAGDASAGYADLEPSNSKAAAHGMPDGLVVSSRPAYLSLRAVVLHYGGPSSGGHYVVYRCLDAAQQQWARVSDEEVRPGVSRQEVLQAEATMLLYEERGQASVSLVSD
ncbi:hypothetical protein N2152v2_004436 [Parachlorella kessleri]